MTNKDGNTPLHWAARDGRKTVVELLLKHDADVHMTNKDGSTPLHLAASYGRTDVVKLLLEGDAAVNVENKAGETPLDVARAKGRKTIVRILEAERQSDLSSQSTSIPTLQQGSARKKRRLAECAYSLRN